MKRLTTIEAELIFNANKEAWEEYDLLTDTERLRAINPTIRYESIEHCIRCVMKSFSNEYSCNVTLTEGGREIKIVKFKKKLN